MTQSHKEMDRAGSAKTTSVLLNGKLKAMIHNIRSSFDSAKDLGASLSKESGDL